MIGDIALSLPCLHLVALVLVDLPHHVEVYHVHALLVLPLLQQFRYLSVPSLALDEHLFLVVIRNRVVVPESGGARLVVPLL
jgi:hypothetical protein